MTKALRNTISKAEIFELLQKADDDAIKKIEDGEEKIKVYENFYLDKETKEVDSTIRLSKIVRISTRYV